MITKTYIELHDLDGHLVMIDFTLVQVIHKGYQRKTEKEYHPEGCVIVLSGGCSLYIKEDYETVIGNL